MTATAEQSGRLRLDTPPPHGPYGRAEQVGGRWRVRLTAEGQRVAIDWLADKADLVAYFAKCFPAVLRYAWAARMSPDEVDAACRRGVCVAVTKWEPGRAALAACAAEWMRSAVQRDADKLTRCRRQTGRPETFDRPDGEQRESLLGAVRAKADPDAARAERAERRAKVLAELRRLPERDRAMFGLLHGLDGSPPLTLREIGEKYGVTHQRVQQVCGRVTERLADACREES